MWDAESLGILQLLNGKFSGPVSGHYLAAYVHSSTRYFWFSFTVSVRSKENKCCSDDLREIRSHKAIVVRRSGTTVGKAGPALHVEIRKCQDSLDTVMSDLSHLHHRCRYFLGKALQLLGLWQPLEA